MGNTNRTVLGHCPIPVASTNSGSRSKKWLSHDLDLEMRASESCSGNAPELLEFALTMASYCFGSFSPFEIGVLPRLANDLHESMFCNSSPRVTSIGSLPPRNLGKCRGPPENPAEPPQNPQRDPAEPSERPPQSPLRGKFPRRASRRVVPPRMVTLRNFKRFSPRRRVVCLLFAFVPLSFSQPVTSREPL